MSGGWKKLQGMVRRWTARLDTEGHDEPFLESARRARKTLFLITGLYVLLGFLIAVPSAFAGDRISAFLGFLIVAGALGGSVGIHMMIRSRARIESLERKVDDLHELLRQVADRLDRPRSAADSDAAEPPATWVDLTTLGDGDPTPLVAASLERDRFPRLVATMEEQPPAQSSPASADVENHSVDAASDPSSDWFPALTTRNLLREWKTGLRRRDVAACRRVYAAVVETVSERESAPLKEQLDRLADDVERELREAFAQCARRKDYAGLLELSASGSCSSFPIAPSPRSSAVWPRRSARDSAMSRRRCASFRKRRFLSTPASVLRRDSNSGGFPPPAARDAPWPASPTGTDPDRARTPARS